ncbi:MAG: hypothetical protein WCI38_08895 [Chthoniobacterales bacterium]
MPKCEKCGYLRATKNYCTSCSSTRPYPRRLLMLRGLFAATLVVIVLFSTIFARQVAAERNAREKAEAGALRTKQETKQRKAKDF